MGSLLSKLIEKIKNKKQVRLLMLGLDNAGKTTILYKLKFDQTVTTIPTAGFNVEFLEYERVRFHVWDVGGQDKIRPLWRHYHTGTKAVIFVVDCQDSDRVGEAALELSRIMTAKELSDAVILIFANKQDLPGSISIHSLTEHLKLHKWMNSGDNSRMIKVQPSCATTGEGLEEGLLWLDGMTGSKKYRKKARKAAFAAEKAAKEAEMVSVNDKSGIVNSGENHNTSKVSTSSIDAESRHRQ